MQSVVRIPFRVLVGDDEFTDAIAISDFVAVEQKWGKPLTSFGADVKSVPVEMLLYGAWNALRRHGKHDESWETWLDRVEGIDFLGEAPAPNGASAASSALSPS